MLNLRNRKFLILDLDGTILNDKKEIFPEFLEVLPRIKRKYSIIIASGRAKFSIERYINEMGIDLRYVGFEGAYIVWDGKVIFDKSFDEKDKKTIENGYGGFALVRFYLNKVSPNERFLKEFFGYLKRWGAEVIGEEGNIYKYVIAVKDQSEIDIEKVPGKVFIYRRNEDVFYDISPGTTKVEGFMKLLETFEIDPKNCVAVGDYYNDIGLFKICGLSVAVPKAPTEVKKHAKVITYPWSDEFLKLLGV